jgi:hypothetical protein
LRRENVLAALAAAQRSTSASQRFLFKLSRRASSNAGHAHSCSQRSSARISAKFDLGLQSWPSSA